MKKAFLTLLLLSSLSAACSKNKNAEIEMQLPTPVPTATSVAMMTPTFAPSPSPTETQAELHYLIEDIQGTVLVTTSDSAVPESAAEGETVEPGDELITKDNSEATLSLNENTLVHLAANSQVQISDLGPNGTGGFKSRIELLLGNILSEVEKLDQSKSSFEIEAGGVVCAVRGTAFEVQKQGDNVSTSTFHGTVEMQKDGHIQKVQANEHSTYALNRSDFLKQRRLNPAEKKHYQTWTRKKNAVQEKIRSRTANPNQTHPNLAKHPKSMTKPKAPSKKIQNVHRPQSASRKLNRRLAPKSQPRNTVHRSAAKPKPRAVQKPKGHPQRKPQPALRPAPKRQVLQARPQRPQKPTAKKKPRKKKDQS